MQALPRAERNGRDHEKLLLARSKSTPESNGSERAENARDGVSKPREQTALTAPMIFAADREFLRDIRTSKLLVGHLACPKMWGDSHESGHFYTTPFACHHTEQLLGYHEDRGVSAFKFEFSGATCLRKARNRFGCHKLLPPLDLLQIFKLLLSGLNRFFCPLCHVLF